MLRITAIAVLLVAFAASPATADEWWEDIQRQGFTAGIGTSVGAMTSVKAFETSATSIESGTAGGLALRAGYRLPRWLGVDLHFEWMNSDLNVDGPKPSIDLEGDWITFTSDFKFILPRWANSEFFLLAGPGLMNIDGVTEFAARYGGGIDIYFTRSVGLTLGGSYIMPTSSLKDLDYAVGEVALFYRF